MSDPKGESPDKPFKGNTFGGQKETGIKSLSHQDRLPDSSLNTSRDEKVLIELCNSYRFFMDFRYKIFHLFAIGNAALLAAYWTMRINNESKSPLEFFMSGLFIRLSGVTVSVVCFLVDRRISGVVADYADKTNALLHRMGGVEQVLIPRPKNDRYISYCLGAATTILCLAWLLTGLSRWIFLFQYKADA
jgi:hypothetical protein